MSSLPILQSGTLVDKGDSTASACLRRWSRRTTRTSTWLTAWTFWRISPQTLAKSQALSHVSVAPKSIVAAGRRVLGHCRTLSAGWDASPAACLDLTSCFCDDYLFVWLILATDARAAPICCLLSNLTRAFCFMLHPVSPAQVPTARQPPELAGFKYHDFVSAAPVGLLDALEHPALNNDTARPAQGCKYATEHVPQHLANDNYPTAHSAPATFTGYAAQPPTGQQAQEPRAGPDAAPQNADAPRQQHCLPGADATRISAAQVSGGNSHSGQQAYGPPSETQQSAGAAPIRQRSKTFGGAMAAAGQEHRCSNNRADESNASNAASGSAAADGTAATQGRPEHSTAEVRRAFRSFSTA